MNPLRKQVNSALITKWYTLDEFEGKKVSVYFSKSKHSQHNFAAPRS